MSPSDRELEYAPRIAFIEGPLVGVGNSHGVAEAHFLWRVLVRVIHRVQHAIDTDHLLAELDGRLPGNTRVGDVHVVAQIVADRMLELLHERITLRAHRGRVHVVQAIKPERQRLAGMADDELQLREPVKHPAHDHAQHVQAGFCAETEYGAIQPGIQIRLDHCRRGCLRMKVDGHIQRLGRFQDRCELWLVQVVTQRMGVDDYCLETELPDAALHLLHGVGWIMRRHGHHAGKAIRMPATGRGELVVGVDCQRTGLGRFEDLHARCSKGDDLVVDAGSIHVGQARCAQILQPVEDELGTRAGAFAVEAPEAAKARVVECGAFDQAAVALPDVGSQKGFFSSDAAIAGITYHCRLNIETNRIVSTTNMSYPDLHLLVDGQRLGRGNRRVTPVINPATGEVLGELPLADSEDLDRALEAARRAWPVWRAMGPQQRGKILHRAADLLRERSEGIARLATIEEGKTLAETRVELAVSAEIFDWYAEEGRRAYGRVLPQRVAGMRMTVVKEPVGPVAGFAPWNFPLGNPARKLGSALGAGCSVIVKPAEETPGSALAIAQALLDAGVPPGTLQVVFGVPAEVSEHLISSPIIRAVHFTGSIPVGKQLTALAAAGMKRTTMELGGHAPVLVFDDVDVDAVLDLAVTSKYRNAGQVCVSPTRFYVHEAIYQRFVEGFAARARSLKVGNGLDESVRMGPLAHDRRLPAVGSLIDEAVRDGAKLLAGGRRLEGPGYFYAPTVLADVPETARIMNEEPFGPVAVLRPFREFDEVIANANRLPYGLAAYAFTQNARRVNLLGEQIESGMLGINSFTIAMPEAPFGGVKESGHGSEEGVEGLEACLVTKFITES